LNSSSICQRAPARARASSGASWSAGGGEEGVPAGQGQAGPAGGAPFPLGRAAQGAAAARAFDDPGEQPQRQQADVLGEQAKEEAHNGEPTMLPNGRQSRSQ